MSDGANKAALAVAHIFHIHDVEWSDRLIELLRDADMEAFRVEFTKLSIDAGWTHSKPGWRLSAGHIARIVANRGSAWGRARKGGFEE